MRSSKYPDPSGSLSPQPSFVSVSPLSFRLTSGSFRPRGSVNYSPTGSAHGPQTSDLPSNLPLWSGLERSLHCLA